MMSNAIQYPAPEAVPPLRPMSWLEWSRVGDLYIGGDYVIRLVEPYRWEILHRDTHVRFEPKLSAALAQAEHHHVERLRRLDLVGWGVVLVASLVAMALVDATVGLTGVWSVPVLCVLLFSGLSALARVLAAASRDRFNPYRRRAPWEPRNWWQR